MDRTFPPRSLSWRGPPSVSRAAHDRAAAAKYARARPPPEVMPLTLGRPPEAEIPRRAKPRVVPHRVPERARVARGE